MNLRAIRLIGLGCFLCISALPLAAGPNTGKIAGVVVDLGGTPQMGATVLVSSEQLLNFSPIQLLTNDRGRFVTSALPPGAYSVKVTLPGFLPAMEQHIRVDDQHVALLQIALGSVFSSLEKLRRQPDQPVSADDWTWVLRSSAASRSVLRWNDDGSITVDDGGSPLDAEGLQEPRGRVELTSGADHPGSVADLADSPATAFVYDMGVGSSGQLLMAGQVSYEDESSAGGLAMEWLPSGKPGAGPVTTFLVRESRLDPAGRAFRGLRMSHDDQLMLSDRVSLRYGAEYMVAGLNRTTSALRPRGEVAIQIADGWQTSVTIATRPWQDTVDEGAMEAALSTFDAFPALLVRDTRPLFENGLHEEVAVTHSLNDRADVSAAVFHDAATHTAVIGRGSVAGPDYLQDYFSQAFAYDGGSSSSTGARVAYRQKLADNLAATIVYAYAGSLAPDGNSDVAGLRDELATRYRQSVAGRVSTTLARSKTKVIVGYKWLNGPTVSRLDPFGESLYHIDPYLSMEIRQPLPSIVPGHMEVQADIGNLLAQGYVPVTTSDGSFTLVPSYRYFRGGLSLQF